MTVITCQDELGHIPMFLLESLRVQEDACHILFLDNVHMSSSHQYTQFSPKQEWLFFDNQYRQYNDYLPEWH